MINNSIPIYFKIENSELASLSLKKKRLKLYIGLYHSIMFSYNNLYCIYFIILQSELIIFGIDENALGLHICGTQWPKTVTLPVVVKKVPL